MSDLVVSASEGISTNASGIGTSPGPSTVPSMRILDRSVVSLNLAKVGMDPPTIKKFREIIDRPNGIVLVTGPTGSGKTTTLYSALTELNTMIRLNAIRDLMRMELPDRKSDVLDPPCDCWPDVASGITFSLFMLIRSAVISNA